MAQSQTFWARLSEAPKYYGGGVYRQMNEKAVFLWSQAIAFKVLVTIVPIVILATGILSSEWLLGPTAFDNVAQYIREFVPYNSESLIGLLQQLQAASTTFTVVGALGLLFSLMTLFTTLRVVVSSIFQEEWHTQRTILRGYAFDIRMAAQVGLLFLLSFGISLALQWLKAADFQFIQQVGLDYVWIQQGWRRVLSMAGLLLPFLLTLAMFFQLFYFVPKPHPPKRSALIGALVTSFLWEAAKFAFTFYASRAGRFSRYDIAPGEEELSYLVNAFGLIIAFVFWIYYSGVVLCIGGIYGLLHEKRYRARRKLKQAEEFRAAHEEAPSTSRRALDVYADDGAERTTKENVTVD